RTHAYTHTLTHKHHTHTHTHTHTQRDIGVRGDRGRKTSTCLIVLIAKLLDIRYEAGIRALVSGQLRRKRSDNAGGFRGDLHQVPLTVHARIQSTKDNPRDT